MHSRIGWTVSFLSLAMLALLAASTPLVAQEHYIKLQNDSNITFREVHVSSVTDRYWERDLLGRNYLRPGYEFTVEMPSGNWDFRFVDVNGDACILHNVTVTRNATVAVTTAWLEDNCTFDLSSTR